MIRSADRAANAIDHVMGCSLSQAVPAPVSDQSSGGGSPLQPLSAVAMPGSGCGIAAKPIETGRTAARARQGPRGRTATAARPGAAPPDPVIAADDRRERCGLRFPQPWLFNAPGMGEAPAMPLAKVATA